MTSPLPTERWNDRDEIEDVVGGVLVSHEGYPDVQGIVRCECGGSEREAFAEHLRRVLADAILAAGFRRSVVSTPSDEERDAREFLAKHYTPAVGWTVEELYLTVLVPQSLLMVGNGESLRLVRDLLDEAGFDIQVIERSAVSAPPTITDEMVERAAAALYTRTVECMPGMARAEMPSWDPDSSGAFDFRRDAGAALRAALGGEVDES